MNKTYLQHLMMLLMALLVAVPSIDAKKKLHTIGDSTMANYAEDNAQNQRGWCQVLQQFFNSDNLTVNNRGKSGASSKSFYKESAYWPTLVKGGSDQMQAGDILIIQFAHNDEKNGGADGDDVKAYYTAKGDAATAASTDYRGTTASGTYKDYIRKYITEAKAMGVKPIVVGGICRKYFSNGEIRRNGRHDLGDSYSVCDGRTTYTTGNKVAATDHTYDYPYQSSLVAAEFDDVPYIDLTALTADLYTSYGEAYCTENMFISSDSTHPCLLGATLIARTFAQAVKDAFEKETSAAKKAVLKELYDELVLSSDISFNPVSGNLGEAYAGKYAKKQYSISAFGLTSATGEVTISASEGFEVSADGETWSTSTKASYKSSTLITSVFVRTKIAAAGTVAGTLTVSDGNLSKTLDISATGKSLVQGTETTCVWPMSTKSVDAVSELLTAKAGVSVGMTEVKGTVTPTTPAGHAAMAYFDIEGSSWPALEIDEVSTRYIQFQATVPIDKDFYLDNISYDVMGWGGNSVCYRAYYATKADFSDQQEIATMKPMTAKTANAVSKEVNLKISDGESIYIRFYPWLNNQASAATGKYLSIGGLTLHGTLAEAGGVNIEGSISYPFTKGGAGQEAILAPEEVAAGFTNVSYSLGSSLVFDGSRNFTTSATNGDNGTPFTKINAATGGSGSSANESNAVTFTLIPDDGFSFIPSSVSFKGARAGTSGGSVEVKATVGDKTVDVKDPSYNLNTDKAAETINTFLGDVSELTATNDNPLKVAIHALSFSAGKTIMLRDIVISGTLVGSASSSTKYYLNLTVSPEAAGVVTVDPDMESYKEGKTVVLSSTPNFGYKFAGWKDGNEMVSTNASMEITMDKDKSIQAVFETVPVYTVDALVKNDLELALGSVTLSPNDHNGKYEEGSEVTLKAETSKILKFMTWEDNSTVNPRSITVDKDITVTANYEVQDFIAVFDASKAQAYDYTGAGFSADITWDANRNAVSQIVKVSDGTPVYSNDGKTVGSAGTPVVRNREGVVLSGINGLYQNGFRTTDIAWQYQFSTKGFTSAKFVADMAAKNMASKSYKARYSLDGKSFTDIAGAAWDVTANVIIPVEFALPAEAIGKDLVYIRITGTGSEMLSSAYEVKAQFLGLDYYDHSESGVGNVFVLGEAVTVADEVAPKLTSTIPVKNATGIPASGNVVLTYDEKIQLSNKVNGFATLNGEKVEPVTSSKSVSFQYVNLEYGKTYTFRMPAGFVEDKSGNAADAVELTFTIMDRQKPQARIYDAIVDKSLNLKYGESIAATENMPKQYRYIQDAINDAPAASTKPYLIYIKEGYYDDPNPYFNDSYGQRYDLTKPDGKGAYEVVNNAVNGNGTDKSDPTKKYDDCKLIFINKPNIHLIGQATDKVTIATDRMDGGDASRPEKVWYHVNAGAAVEIQSKGNDALLSTLTIDNENWTKDKKAGPQALCLNTEADRLTFNELNVRSYQDDYKCSGTYNRAFWNKTRFEGAVDYIYGDCDVWFEECVQDIVRKSGGYIVAPSHPKETRWGYIFNNNTIKSSMFGADCQVWLGRPWHNYPKTVFMNSKVELKTYDLYWAETMGGLPALWAVKNLTDKNGVALTEVSRSSYYADQPDGHFAAGTYTSKQDLGNGKFRFTNANTKNSLSDEEFAEYTIQNVMAGDKSTEPTGYWNPLPKVEKTATPAPSVNGNIAQWAADEYAISYVVTVNGKPTFFTTDTRYVGKEGEKVQVQSVNEFGVLSAMSETVTLAKATDVQPIAPSLSERAWGESSAGRYTFDGKAIGNANAKAYIQNGQKYSAK